MLRSNDKGALTPATPDRGRYPWLARALRPGQGPRVSPLAKFGALNSWAPWTTSVNGMSFTARYTAQGPYGEQLTLDGLSERIEEAALLLVIDLRDLLKKRIWQLAIVSGQLGQVLRSGKCLNEARQGHKGNRKDRLHLGATTVRE